MDGTLTVAAHDFEAIRARLGLPSGRPILEALAALAPATARPLYLELDRIEMELALCSRPSPGAGDLLNELRARGVRPGLLTRNNRANVHATLRAAGLAKYFDDETILTRDDAPPKPVPDGILILLRRLKARATDAVMVGDFLFDLQAGRAAGTGTVYLDPSGVFPYREHADLCVRALSDLR